MNQGLYKLVFSRRVGMFVPVAAELPVRGLAVFPADVQLSGPRGVQQLLVTANAADADVHDLTASAQYTSQDPAVATVKDGVIHAAGNGSTVVRIQAGGQEASVKVTVAAFETASPVVFHTEILAALTKSGCNMGACHGSPSGKGGFRLSLRGYDPPLDLVTLRGEYFNRRSNVLNPADSLLLRKPLMEVAHGGGRRLGYNDPSHVVLRQWIAEGMKVAPEGTPTLVSIELFPKPRDKRTSYVAFRDLDAAIELLVRMRSATGDQVASFEYLPRNCMQMALDHIPGTSDPMSQVYDDYALIEVSRTADEDAGFAGLDGLPRLRMQDLPEVEPRVQMKPRAFVTLEARPFHLRGTEGLEHAEVRVGFHLACELVEVLANGG